MKIFPSLNLRRAFIFMSIFAIIGVTATLAGPSISVSSSPTTITNEGQESVFTFTLSSPATRNITLNFITGGLAVLGSDYILYGNGNRGQFVIPKGASSATLTMHTFVNDIDLSQQQNAILQILGGKRYQVGSPSAAQVIIDNQK